MITPSAKPAFQSCTMGSTGGSSMVPSQGVPASVRESLCCTTAALRHIHNELQTEDDADEVCQTAGTSVGLLAEVARSLEKQPFPEQARVLMSTLPALRQGMGLTLVPKEVKVYHNTRDEADTFLLRPLAQLCHDVRPGRAAVVIEHRGRHQLLLIRTPQKSRQPAIMLFDPSPSRVGNRLLHFPSIQEAHPQVLQAVNGWSEDGKGRSKSHRKAQPLNLWVMLPRPRDLQDDESQKRVQEAVLKLRKKEKARIILRMREELARLADKAHELGPPPIAESRGDMETMKQWGNGGSVAQHTEAGTATAVPRGGISGQIPDPVPTVESFSPRVALRSEESLQRHDSMIVGAAKHSPSNGARTHLSEPKHIHGTEDGVVPFRKNSGTPSIQHLAPTSTLDHLQQRDGVGNEVSDAEEGHSVAAALKGAQDVLRMSHELEESIGRILSESLQGEDIEAFSNRVYQEIKQRTLRDVGRHAQLQTIDVLSQEQEQHKLFSARDRPRIGSPGPAPQTLTVLRHSFDDLCFSMPHDHSNVVEPLVDAVKPVNIHHPPSRREQDGDISARASVTYVTGSGPAAPYRNGMDSRAACSEPASAQPSARANGKQPHTRRRPIRTPQSPSLTPKPLAEELPPELTPSSQQADTASHRPSQEESHRVIVGEGRTVLVGSRDSAFEVRSPTSSKPAIARGLDEPACHKQLSKRHQQHTQHSLPQDKPVSMQTRLCDNHVEVGGRDAEDIAPVLQDCTRDSPASPVDRVQTPCSRSRESLGVEEEPELQWECTNPNDLPTRALERPAAPVRNLHVLTSPWPATDASQGEDSEVYESVRVPCDWSPVRGLNRPEEHHDLHQSLEVGLELHAGDTQHSEGLGSPGCGDAFGLDSAIPHGPDVGGAAVIRESSPAGVKGHSPAGAKLEWGDDQHNTLASYLGYTHSPQYDVSPQQRTNGRPQELHQTSVPEDMQDDEEVRAATRVCVSQSPERDSMQRFESPHMVHDGQAMGSAVPDVSAMTPRDEDVVGQDGDAVIVAIDDTSAVNHCCAGHHAKIDGGGGGEATTTGLGPIGEAQAPCKGPDDGPLSAESGMDADEVEGSSVQQDVHGVSRTFSELLNSTDGEYVEYFSKKLFAACKAKAPANPVQEPRSPQGPSFDRSKPPYCVADGHHAVVAGAQVPHEDQGEADGLEYEEVHTREDNPQTRYDTREAARYEDMEYQAVGRVATAAAAHEAWEFEEEQWQQVAGQGSLSGRSCPEFFPEAAVPPTPMADDQDLDSASPGQANMESQGPPGPLDWDMVIADDEQSQQLSNELVTTEHLVQPVYSSTYSSTSVPPSVDPLSASIPAHLLQPYSLAQQPSGRPFPPVPSSPLPPVQVTVQAAPPALPTPTTPHPLSLSYQCLPMYAPKQVLSSSPQQHSPSARAAINQHDVAVRHSIASLDVRYDCRPAGYPPSDAPAAFPWTPRGPRHAAAAVEWQMRQTRERISKAEQLERKRRAEDSMRVKMEALKYVLGLDTEDRANRVTVPPPPLRRPQQGFAAAAPTSQHQPGATHMITAATMSAGGTSSCVALPPPGKPHHQQRWAHRTDHQSKDGGGSARSARDDCGPASNGRMRVDSCPTLPHIVPPPPTRVVRTGGSRMAAAVQPVSQVQHQHHSSQHHHPVQQRPRQQASPQHLPHSIPPPPAQPPPGHREQVAPRQLAPTVEYEGSGPGSVRPDGVQDSPVNEETRKNKEHVGIMEVNVLDSMSPEERQRRQQRFDELRARKLREAQERDEARRHRNRAPHRQRGTADSSDTTSNPSACSPTSSHRSPHSPSTRPPSAAAATSAAAASADPPAREPTPPKKSSSSSSTIPPPPPAKVNGFNSTKTARGMSNAKLIRNALSHVCLAGVIMEPQRGKALAALDKHLGMSFVVLFNSSNALTFRGLYVHEGGGLAPGENAVRKVYGAGPAIIKEEWVEAMYKYNSASRSFQQVPSRTFTVMTDGVSLDLSTLRRVAKDISDVRS